MNKSKINVLDVGIGSKKYVGNETILLKPICYEDFSTIGIALTNNSFVRVYDFGIPTTNKKIIAIYRSMKIAEYIDYFPTPKINLCACFIAGHKDKDKYPTLRKEVDYIESQVGEHEMKQIMKMTPYDLEEIILSMQSRGVDFDKKELVDESKYGNINDTGAVSEIIDSMNPMLVEKH